jgi:hypothetical protein
MEQIRRLIRENYPEAANMSEGELDRHVHSVFEKIEPDSLLAIIRRIDLMSVIRDEMSRPGFTTNAQPDLDWHDRNDGAEKDRRHRK